MDQLLRLIISARDRASRSLQSVERRLEGIGKQSKGVVAGFKNLRVAALAAGAAIAGAAVAFTRMVRAGGEFLNVQRAFQQQVGNSTAAIEQLRAATGGLISNYQLMVQFNRAVSLGAAETTEDFARLSRTAIELGKALGVDVNFALESLATGIGRRSRLILDNLGIIVSGLESMSQEQVIETVLGAADQKLADMGVSSENAADGIQRLSVAFSNLVSRVGAFLAQSGPLQQTLNAIATVAEVVTEGAPGTRAEQLRRQIRDLRQQQAFGGNARIARELALAQFELSDIQRRRGGPRLATAGIPGAAPRGRGGTGLRFPAAISPTRALLLRRDPLSEVDLFRRTGFVRGPTRGVRPIGTGEPDIRMATVGATDALLMFRRSTIQAGQAQTRVSQANLRMAAGLLTVGNAITQFATGGGFFGGLSGLLGGIAGLVSNPLLGAGLGVAAGLFGRLAGGRQDRGPLPVSIARIEPEAADAFTVIVTNQVVGATNPEQVQRTNARLTRERNLDGIDPFGVAFQ